MSDPVVAMAGVILAAVFGVLTLVQTARANRFSRDCARLQGVFDAAALRVNLFETELDRDHFHFALPLADRTVVVAPLPLIVRNTGSATAKDLEVNVRIPKTLAGTEGGRHALLGMDLKTTAFEVSSQTEQLVTLAFAVKNLHPNQEHRLQLTVPLAHETLVPVTTTATSKDGHEIEVSAMLEYSYAIDVTVFAENLAPVSRRFTLYILAAGKDELEARYADLNAVRAKRSAPSERRFWKRSHRCPPKHLALVTATCKEHATAGAGDVKLLVTDSYSICDGIELPTGFFIPAVGVAPPDITVVSGQR